MTHKAMVTDKMVKAAVASVSDGVDWVRGLFGLGYNNAEEVMRDALTAALAQVETQPHAAMTVDHTGCEHMSRDIALIEQIAKDGGDPVTYLFASPVPVKREAGDPVLLRNLRDTFDAMCAMRDSINEYIPMPSLESDLLHGPETSVFCATVAEAVISAFQALTTSYTPADGEGLTTTDGSQERLSSMSDHSCKTSTPAPQPNMEWRTHDGMTDPDVPGDTLVQVCFRDGDTAFGIVHDWDQNWQWADCVEGLTTPGAIIAWRPHNPAPVQHARGDGEAKKMVEEFENAFFSRCIVETPARKKAYETARNALVAALTVDGKSSRYPKQSFDEIVENALRIWFGNFDKMDEDAKATYRVPMRHIIEFAWTQSPQPSFSGSLEEKRACIAQAEAAFSNWWGFKLNKSESLRWPMREAFLAGYSEFKRLHFGTPAPVSRALPTAHSKEGSTDE